MTDSLKAQWDFVLQHKKHFSHISAASMLLAWDQETKMPVAAGAHRAETMGVLSGLAHHAATSSEYGEALKKLSEYCQGPQSDSFSPEESAIIRELTRDYQRQSRLPSELVQELSQTTSLSQQAWSEARQKNDPQIFLPWLEKIITLSKQAGECLKQEGQTSYDALIDEFEPGAKTSQLTVLFDHLVQELVPLVRKIESRPLPDESFLKSDWDLKQQEKWSLFLLEAMGFDFDKGRLDISEHPFTEGIHSSDVRLTTRYDLQGFFDSLFSTVHEGGHGLYEQGFLDQWSCTPMAEAVSLGVHESQSRLWENQVARGADFWKWAWPHLQTFFPQNLEGVSFENFYRAVNCVRPGLIRVDADEVTYNLHIAMRFQIERELFDEGLPVSQVEARWNELSDQYLGIIPSSPMEGFMQDVHWSVGLFGYFPTYTLGNLMSAQLFDQFKKEVPQCDAQFSEGDFSYLKKWLNEKVHQKGKLFSAEDLVESITGQKLQASYFVDYLKNKYGPLYGIKHS